MKLSYLAGAVFALAAASTVQAAGFINGGFESGDTTGWTVGNGSRSSQNTSAINPSSYLNGNTGRSAVVGPGLDPVLGSLMPNIVFDGAFAYRVEDAGVTGGNLSVISQTVKNYTDSSIFFTWLAALDNGGHTAEQSAAMIITLKDLTTNTVVIDRRYNAGAGGGGVDSRFLVDPTSGYFYTPKWQTEQLTIDASLSGHDFQLIVLASDCAPAAHSGYVYVDGFGNAAPQPTVTEPSSLALAGLAVLGAAAARRRKKA
jgi:MYXO-CTERM domain-containing protein